MEQYVIKGGNPLVGEVEIGGAKKSHRQIRDVENAFVVRDDMEYANGDILPLWSFGLLY